MLNLMDKLYQQQNLSTAEAENLFGQLLRGELDPCLIAGLLTALKIKGETPDEITGAARALIAAATPFPRPDYAFGDIVGTGGDGLHTINISTISAIVGATCGLKIAKHGNRSVSSQTGSSDLLAQFGVNLEMTPATARACLDATGVTFLFAPRYHSGMRFAAPVRQALKTRTVFNVLGPLINPARPTYQMMGVYAADLLQPMAKTLQQLGLCSGWVVYGDGLDEIAVHGETRIAEIQDEAITMRTITPATFGLRQFALPDIQGGDPDENRQITEKILSGHGSDAQNTAIAVNLAPMLLMGKRVTTLQEGAELTLSTLCSGKPLDTIHQLATLSHKEA